MGANLDCGKRVWDKPYFGEKSGAGMSLEPFLFDYKAMCFQQDCEVDGFWSSVGEIRNPFTGDPGPLDNQDKLSHLCSKAKNEESVETCDITFGSCLKNE
jgi:hypothetical protein